MIKQAASNKVRSMTQNARDVHKLGDDDHNGERVSFGRALINFSALERRYESAGGFRWTWIRIFDGRLLEEEGISISSRVWAGMLDHSILGNISGLESLGYPVQ